MGDRPTEAGRPLGRGPRGGGLHGAARRAGGANATTGEPARPAASSSSPSTTVPQEERDLERLLDAFVDQVPGAVSAVVVTTDGLVLALSDHIVRDAAERLAAITSGLASLTAGAARSFDAGTVARIVVEMTGGYLFVTVVGDRAALAVVCETDCEIGLIGYETTLLAERIGPALAPAVGARATLAVPPVEDPPPRTALPRRLPPDAP